MLLSMASVTSEVRRSFCFQNISFTVVVVGGACFSTAIGGIGSGWTTAESRKLVALNASVRLAFTRSCFGLGTLG